MRGGAIWRRLGLASAIVIVLGLVFAPGMTLAKEATTIRPIGDFLAAQTETVGWINEPPRDLFIRVDYAGLINNRIVALGGASLGTTTLGTVTERPLADGRAEVTVVLRTSNAWTVVREFSLSTGLGAFLFGHSIPAVAGGADAALSESLFKVVFINTAPGAPLLDLAGGPPAPGVELISLSIVTDGTGTLRAAFGVPDGTPGRAQTTQIGLFMTAFMGATADAFPAEHIDLKVVGS